MNNLDQDVINLAKSIRQVESQNNPQAKGKSGEYGAYQFMPDTWASTSRKYLGKDIPLEQATLEDQNKVAYSQIKEWKYQGYNPGQIASMWNAGGGKPNAYLEGHAGVNEQGVAFDTPAYAKKVYDTYKQLKGQPQISQSVSEGQVATESLPETAEPEKKTFGGFLGNVAKSGIGLVGGAINAIAHPIETAKTLGKTALGVAQKVIPGEQKSEEYANALGQYFKERYGSAKSLGDTAYSDPVGFLTDVATVLSGGGALATKLGTAGKVGELAKAGQVASKIGSVAEPLNIPQNIGKGTRAVTTPLLQKTAQKMEARSLSMTPSAKRKLIQKETKLDRTPELSETEVVKYGTSKKLTGSPEERAAQHRQILEDLETQIDRAVDNSVQTVTKADIIRELEKIPNEYKSRPTQYKSIKKVVDEKIDSIKSGEFFPGESLTMREIQDLKRDAWEASKFDSTVSNNARTAERASGHVFKNAIEDAFEKGGESIFGKSPKDFNQEYGIAIQYQKLLDNALGKNELGLLGRGIGTLTGHGVMDALGTGVLGEAAGAVVGEKAAKMLAGTSMRSRVGSTLQKMSEKKEPGLIKKALNSKSVKRAAKTGYYSGEIEEKRSNSDR